MKREIVAASFEPGASVSLVARRYDVNTNQLFAWRKLHREVASSGCGPRLLPVTVTAEPAVAIAPKSSGDRVIEIELSDKYRLRVGGDVDAKALRRVLDALERR